MPSLRHRIAGNFAAQANNITTEKLIDMLLELISPDERYERPAA